MSNISPDRFCLKKIIGVSGYEIDKNGTVWSCVKLKPVGKKGWRGGGGFESFLSNEWKALVPYSNKRKYFMLNFHRGGQRICRNLHRLIAECFIPNPENKPCVCHKNGNPQDNRIDNLYWGTVKENMSDRKKHKKHYTFPCGDKHFCAKLNEKQVRVIKHIFTIPNRITLKNIAKIFNVKTETVKAILYIKTWKHVSLTNHND